MELRITYVLVNCMMEEDEIHHWGPPFAFRVPSGRKEFPSRPRYL